MTVYLVSGRRRFRCHEPGETFEATLPRGMEQRALAVGSIQVVENSVPSLQPGTYRLPSGWSNEQGGK